MQRGIAASIILIVLAVLFGVAAVAYGYFGLTGQSLRPKQTVELPPIELIPSPFPESIEQLGTPGCPDTDYTGCDTSSQFMTWDGEIPQNSGVTSEGVIYSK